MTTAAGSPLLTISGLVKNYQTLRPLRINALSISAGELVAISGLDAAAAEMFVGLVTGAVLPDSGEIRLFGQSTGAVADSEAWLAMLDGVGILTERAVFIGQFSVEQNIAMSFTLAVDPIGVEVQPRTRALAHEVGLHPDVFALRVADAEPDVQQRVRLARAIAFAPSLLVAEHPSAGLPRESVAAFAANLGRIARARSMAVLAITADHEFANALGGQTLVLEAATGTLRSPGIWNKVMRRFNA